jgi:hypothetical protein
LTVPLFIAIAVPVAGAIVLFSLLSSRKRRQALAAWAAAHGMSFDPAKHRGLAEHFPDFDCFHKGGGRYAYNVMTGYWKERAFLGFDYHYTSGAGDNSQSYRFSAVILESAVPLQPLSIRPVNLLDKIASYFGHKDIAFDSPEFSRKFHVSSPDEKWAREVVHARTMDLLLASPVFEIKFSPTHVVAYRGSAFKPDDFTAAADLAGGILDLLPDGLLGQQTPGK